MKLSHFNTQPFVKAVKTFFVDLKIPVNYISEDVFRPEKILPDYHSSNASHSLIEEIYAIGTVDSQAFEQTRTINTDELIKDYEFIMLFGIKLKSIHKPTRSQLAEITRLVNKAFNVNTSGNPVTVVYSYGSYIALANTERQTRGASDYRQGEKLGKVSLLRDIDIEYTHSGHRLLLDELKISAKVSDYQSLYKHWQEKFSVSLLNRKFYQELSYWYFWAIKHVSFPGKPGLVEATKRNMTLEELENEHNATNVIRMLTRLLFVWFIKEKKLIPEDLFDLRILQKDILKEINPYHETGLFTHANKESVYYKAILQNLFFASLNCPIEPDNIDKRSRAFRGDGYGTHRGIDYLMRYKQYFQNPVAFLDLVNSKVPFLNGGIFECLDDKTNNIYIDGFSDQMTKNEKLVVPDYLFFGTEEKIDISKDLGVSNAGTKNAAVKGLINILKSYKFTITENTPVEEEVALDPELLGKVFENLLASYNPETKTTARKQTGSFYTPREIVNYMVDESLMAYLKNSLEGDVADSDYLESNLKALTSYGPKQPFENNPELKQKTIEAISNCTILDPACGSGAYPMGILQKMVHMLQKLDPDNTYWKEVQKAKILTETEEAFDITDKNTREERLLEINNAFDQDQNDPDYARKLFLIENCIYGVDIQPIATQISKLRFFISLVVDQKVLATKPNFGIRPLPNLETKFVAANTLIGINKPKTGDQLAIYNTENLRQLENKLKNTRHKLFNAKSKDTKLKYREQDEHLRTEIANELKNTGWANDAADMLANWDPYDQNSSSPFFDKEWMFDIREGFDIVIGNPPYGVSIKGNFRNEVLRHLGKVPDFEIYYYFIEVSKKLLKENGLKSYIIPNTFLFNVFASEYRKQLLKDWAVHIIDCTTFKIFEGATVLNAITFFRKGIEMNSVAYKNTSNAKNFTDLVAQETLFIQKDELLINNQNWSLAFKLGEKVLGLIAKIKKDSIKLENLFPDYSQGLIAYDKYQGQSKETIKNRVFHFNSFDKKVGLKKNLWGEDVNRYNVKWNEKEWIDYNGGIANPRLPKFFKGERVLIREITNPRIFAAYTEDELYHDPSIIVVLSNNDFNIKFLLSILNSKLLTFYHFNSSPKASKGAFPKILVEDIKNFPIKKAGADFQFFFIDLVDKILAGKKASEDTQGWEDEIDLWVYKLYELTYAEVLVIDPAFELSEEEYEGLRF